LSKEKKTNICQTSTWTPPDEATVKINTDAAFREQTNNGGWGVICRDSDSDICFTAAGSLPNVSNAFQAEAMALSNAIDIADNLGVGKVAFETDCINLKNAMSSSEYDLGPMGILLCDMKYRLRTCFTEACVLYTPRGCNKPAHELAALGVGLAPDDHVFWTMSYPNSVTRLVTGDRAMS
jgi:hypothetical protein